MKKTESIFTDFVEIIKHSSYIEGCYYFQHCYYYYCVILSSLISVTPNLRDKKLFCIYVLVQSQICDE